MADRMTEIEKEEFLKDNIEGILSRLEGHVPPDTVSIVRDYLHRRAFQFAELYVLNEELARQNVIYEAMFHEISNVLKDQS